MVMFHYEVGYSVDNIDMIAPDEAVQEGGRDGFGRRAAQEATQLQPAGPGRRSFTCSAAGR
jgi:hypothetical protein